MSPPPAQLLAFLAVFALAALSRLLSVTTSLRPRRAFSASASPPPSSARIPGTTSTAPARPYVAAAYLFPSVWHPRAAKRYGAGVTERMRTFQRELKLRKVLSVSVGAGGRAGAVVEKIFGLYNPMWSG